MAPRNMPPAEVDVDAELVRRLLSAQHPDLADLELRVLANGWDNAMFRLGDTHTVRLPRREAAAALVVNEATWLAGWGARLPIPISEPVRTGRPSPEYPWHWNVGPWYPGTVAADTALADPARDAARLGEFLTALHVPVPGREPVNPYRGHAVAELGDRVRANIDRLAGEIDAGATHRRWQELSAVDEWPGPPVMLHGDLHTANVLVHDGTISAVIDWGDVTVGDPACDLAIAWMLFEGDARATFRATAAGHDEALWSRAAAWALHFAIVYRLNSADNPRFDRMARQLYRAVMA